MTLDLKLACTNSIKFVKRWQSKYNNNNEVKHINNYKKRKVYNLYIECVSETKKILLACDRVSGLYVVQTSLYRFMLKDIVFL